MSDTGVARHGLGYPTPALRTKRDVAPRSALTETNPEITIASQVGFYEMWRAENRSSYTF